jgi:hypothetical protein
MTAKPATGTAATAVRQPQAFVSRHLDDSSYDPFAIRIINQIDLSILVGLP